MSCNCGGLNWVHIDTVRRGRELAVLKAVHEERERILYILENTPIVGVGDVEIMQIGRQHLIELIKGGTND